MFDLFIETLMSEKHPETNIPEIISIFLLLFNLFNVDFIRIKKQIVIWSPPII